MLNLTLLKRKFIYVYLGFILQSLLFQSMHQLYIEFSHIKPLNIFSIQINHISMRDSSFSINCQKMIIFSPRKRAF